MDDEQAARLLSRIDEYLIAEWQRQRSSKETRMDAKRPLEAEKEPGFIRLLVELDHHDEYVYYVPAEVLWRPGLPMSDALRYVEETKGVSGIIGARWFGDQDYVNRKVADDKAT